MNICELSDSIHEGHIEWQRHSLERMMERNISRDNVIEILKSGEIIEDYPEDTPYPSALFLGWIDEEPLHVVVALDSVAKRCFIITAYRPDLEHFESNYRTRK